VRKHPFLQMFVMGMIGVAILLPIALVVPWFPSQASAQASKVDTLYDVLLIASVPVFVLVETVVLFSVWKYRMKPGEEHKDGPPIHGNTRLEVMWTAAPTILIVALCTYAYTVLHSNESKKANAATVDVIGEQFAWMFSYPQQGGQAIVSNQMYLPQNQPVVFKIHSRDVIHAFWVPAFREQLDAVPGITGTVHVTPTKLGVFPLVCAELCGNGHSLMRATVRVVPQAEYQAWLSQQKPQAAPSYSFAPAAGAPATAPSASAPGAAAPSSTAATGAAAAGKALFVGAGTCATCHTLAAAGSTGTIGPNLSVRLAPDCKLPASIKARGATLQQCITTAITKPYAFIPTGYQTGIMPATFSQTLSPDQISSLVAFIVSVTK
jgi:cytochrome c oxidase subunit 2